MAQGGRLAQAPSRVAMPRTASPTRSDRRKARTVQAIFDAAERKFLEHGYHGTTVEEIAQAADVSVGSIYVHFQSKDSLYLALIERALDVQERYMDEAFRPTLSLGQQLFAAGWAYLRFYLDHPGYFRILAFPHFDARPEGEVSFAEQRLAERAEAGVRRVASIIELGVKTGAARPVDPYRAAKFMWGAWAGVIALNMRPDRLRLDDAELEAVLDEGRRMIAEGIAAMALRQPDGTLRPEFDMAPPAAQTAAQPTAAPTTDTPAATRKGATR